MAGREGGAGVPALASTGYARHERSASAASCVATSGRGPAGTWRRQNEMAIMWCIVDWIPGTFLRHRIKITVVGDGQTKKIGFFLYFGAFCLQVRFVHLG